MLSINSWAVAYPDTRTNKPGCGCACYNPLNSTLTVSLPLEPHDQDLDFTCELNQSTAHDRANLRHMHSYCTYTHLLELFLSP